MASKRYEKVAKFLEEAPGYLEDPDTVCIEYHCKGVSIEHKIGSPFCDWQYVGGEVLPKGESPTP